MPKKSIPYVCLSMITITGGVAPVGAQTAEPAIPVDGALSDIIVTARRREEKLQQTPVTITAVGAQALERQRIETPDKLQDIVPNLASTPMPSVLGGGATFIRGIGTAELLVSVDSPIGTYVDGVYIGRNVSANLGLVSPHRVEVLRGPQGTLFGRNTTGGAVSISTPRPSDRFAVEAKLGLASFSERSGQVRVDSGELGTSGISAILAYQHRQRDGYVDNPLAKGHDDPGALNSDAVFAKLHGEWDNLTLDYTYDRADLRGVAMAFQIEYATPAFQNYYARSPALGGQALPISPGRLGTLPQRVLDRQKVKNYGHALTAQLTLSDSVSVKSISAYRNYDARQPVAYAPAGVRGVTTTGVTEVYPFQSDENTFRSQHQYSQELQLLGDFDELTFVGGGYYFKEKAAETAPTSFTFLLPLTQTVGLNSASSTAYSVTGRSAAAFGQASYKPDFLDRKLELTLGARYTSDRKTINQTRPNVRTDARTDHNTSYIASLSYQFTSDLMTYGRYGTGYRSGGFNARAGAGVNFAFAPEKVETYEVGFKSDWLHRTLRTNVALFYTDYKNLQVPQFTGAGGTGGTGFTRNANAHLKGFEVEGQWAPVPRLLFDGSVGYVKAVIDELFLPAPGTGILTNFASISHLQYVPAWTVHGGAQYDLANIGDADISIRADYSWRSTRYFHNNALPTTNPFNNQIAQKGYGLLGASLVVSNVALGGGRGTASLFAENLLDRNYRVQGVDFGSLGFAGNVYGVPRRLGVELKLNY